MISMSTIYDIITGKILTETQDNKIGEEGNKLKLKQVSYQNCIKHVQNLKISLPETEIKRETKAETKTIPFLASAKEKVMRIVPYETLDLRVGGPSQYGVISVKENMFKNMNRKGNDILKKEPRLGVEEVSVPKNEVDNNNEVVDRKEPTTTKVVLEENPINSEEISDSSTISFEEYNKKLEEARALFLQKKTEADRLKESARKSEEELNIQAVKAAEADKRYMDMEKQVERNIATINDLYKKQYETLVLDLKEIQGAIEEAKRKDEENNAKLNELQESIDQMNIKIKQKAETIADQEETIANLSQFNGNDFETDVYSYSQEEQGRRIA